MAAARGVLSLSDWEREWTWWYEQQVIIIRLSFAKFNFKLFVPGSENSFEFS